MTITGVNVYSFDSEFYNFTEQVSDYREFTVSDGRSRVGYGGTSGESIRTRGRGGSRSSLPERTSHLKPDFERSTRRFGFHGRGVTQRETHLFGRKEVGCPWDLSCHTRTDCTPESPDTDRLQPRVSVLFGTDSSVPLSNRDYPILEPENWILVPRQEEQPSTKVV